MAWLRSEQSLLHHPKTKLLQSYLKTSLPETIGKLHMLWYWCLDYALDGDLSHKSVKMIEQSCDIPLKLLIKAKFIDVRPYRRIHDWWAIQGNYLKIRFKNQPENWQRIENLYKRSLEPSMHRSVDRSIEPSRDSSNSMDVTDVTYGRRIRTDGRDVDLKKHGAKSGSANAPPALPETATPEPTIKNYEDAKGDELCGPPPNMAKMLKEQIEKSKRENGRSGGTA